MLARPGSCIQDAAACRMRGLGASCHAAPPPSAGRRGASSRVARAGGAGHVPAPASKAAVAFVWQAGNQQSGDEQDAQQQQQLMAFPDLLDPQERLLCDVFGLAPADARLLLLTCPAASCMDGAQLAAARSQLRRLLPVPPPQLLQAMLQLPDLLAQPQQVMAARLAAGAEALGVPAARLKGRRAARTPELHWRLLVTPEQRLGQQLVQLRELLGGLGLAQLAAMVCAEPKLLSVDGAALLSSIEALEQVCSCPLARLLPQLQREPRVLVQPAGLLYEVAARLQQQLRLSEEGLALVLRRCPGALLVHSGRLQELLAQLSADLAVSQEVAIDVLLQEPRALARSPGAVSAVLAVLKATFRLGPEELMQVVQFDPSMLCFPPGSLADNTRQFKRLAASCAPWAAEYKHLMSRPANVARALRIEPLRLQRLVFLSRQGKAASISLRAALTLSGPKFLAVFPQFREWLQLHYSGGNAPRRYARSAGDEGDEDEDEDAVDDVTNY